MSLHEHVVFLETVDPADKSDRAADKIHDLRDPNKGMGLPMHCLDLLCHYNKVMHAYWEDLIESEIRISILVISSIDLYIRSLASNN